MTDQIVVREQPTNELERVHKELAHWRGRAFLLTPYSRTQFDSIKAGYRPEFRVTYISPEIEDQQVYKLDGQKDKLVLTKIGLQLLDHLAGIKWVRVWNALDKTDPIDDLFCKKSAEGRVQDLDGEYRNSICSSTLDLREGSAMSERMMRPIDGRPNDGKQLARARLNIQSQTETLAKNKVRRELLGLQGTYTRDELSKKPFVILKLNPVRDMNDPLIRKLTIMEQFNISSDLYDQAVKEVVPITTELYLPPQSNQLDITPEPAPVETAPDLLKRVEDLYKRKVRGGRPLHRAPLNTLSDQQLLEIEKLLAEKPDIT